MYVGSGIMAQVEGVRAEERWLADAEGSADFIRAKEEYRKTSDDSSRRRDGDREESRGRDRRDYSGEERSRRGGEERSRRDGDERSRRPRERRDGEDRVRGDDERRRGRDEGQERRRRREDESPEKEREAVPERAPVAEKPSGRSGGVYIPPFKLAQMMKDVDDKSSVQYQRMTWDALRKSINGLVNKVCLSCVDYFPFGDSRV
jgi:pre-mRNA-splicing factor CWC22